MSCMSQWHCDLVKPLLVRLCSLGTTLGTRPRCCTPLAVPLVVVQTRPDIRVRVRRIVIRIRVRHTAIRIRVVVAAIDHTAYGSFRLLGYKGTQFHGGVQKNFQIRRAYARILMSSYLRHPLYALSLRSRFSFTPLRLSP